MSNSSKFNKKISQHNRIILTTICIGVFAASQCYAAESAAVGVDVLKTSMSALKTMLLGDARRVIDVCIVTAGAGGAVMSKNWVPIAVSAMGLVGYELLCASLAQ